MPESSSDSRPGRKRKLPSADTSTRSLPLPAYGGGKRVRFAEPDLRVKDGVKNNSATDEYGSHDEDEDAAVETENDQPPFTRLGESMFSFPRHYRALFASLCRLERAARVYVNCLFCSDQDPERVILVRDFLRHYRRHAPVNREACLVCGRSFFRRTLQHVFTHLWMCLYPDDLPTDRRHVSVDRDYVRYRLRLGERLGLLSACQQAFWAAGKQAGDLRAEKLAARKKSAEDRARMERFRGTANKRRTGTRSGDDSPHVCVYHRCVDGGRAAELADHGRTRFDHRRALEILEERRRMVANIRTLREDGFVSQPPGSSTRQNAVESLSEENSTGNSTEANSGSNAGMRLSGDNSLPKSSIGARSGPNSTANLPSEYSLLKSSMESSMEARSGPNSTANLPSEYSLLKSSMESSMEARSGPNSAANLPSEQSLPKSSVDARSGPNSTANLSSEHSLPKSSVEARSGPNSTATLSSEYSLPKSSVEARSGPNSTANLSSEHSLPKSSVEARSGPNSTANLSSEYSLPKSSVEGRPNFAENLPTENYIPKPTKARFGPNKNLAKSTPETSFEADVNLIRGTTEASFGPNANSAESEPRASSVSGVVAENSLKLNWSAQPTTANSAIGDVTRSTGGKQPSETRQSDSPGTTTTRFWIDEIRSPNFLCQFAYAERCICAATCVHVGESTVVKPTSNQPSFLPRDKKTSSSPLGLPSDLPSGLSSSSRIKSDGNGVSPFAEDGTAFTLQYVSTDLLAQDTIDPFSVPVHEHMLNSGESGDDCAFSSSSAPRGEEFYRIVSRFIRNFLVKPSSPPVPAASTLAVLFEDSGNLINSLTSLETPMARGFIRQSEFYVSPIASQLDFPMRCYRDGGSDGHINDNNAPTYAIISTINKQLSAKSCQSLQSLPSPFAYRNYTLVTRVADGVRDIDRLEAAATKRRTLEASKSGCGLSYSSRCGSERACPGVRNLGDCDKNDHSSSKINTGKFARKPVLEKLEPTIGDGTRMQAFGLGAFVMGDTWNYAGYGVGGAVGNGGGGGGVGFAWTRNHLETGFRQGGVGFATGDSWGGNRESTGTGPGFVMGDSRGGNRELTGTSFATGELWGGNRELNGTSFATGELWGGNRELNGTSFATGRGNRELTNIGGRPEFATSVSLEGNRELILGFATDDLWARNPTVINGSGPEIRLENHHGPTGIVQEKVGFAPANLWQNAMGNVNTRMEFATANLGVEFATSDLAAENHKTDREDKLVTNNSSTFSRATDYSSSSNDDWISSDPSTSVRRDLSTDENCSNQSSSSNRSTLDAAFNADSTTTTSFGDSGISSGGGGAGDSLGPDCSSNDDGFPEDGGYDDVCPSKRPESRHGATQWLACHSCGYMSETYTDFQDLWPDHEFAGKQLAYRYQMPKVRLLDTFLNNELFRQKFTDVPRWMRELLPVGQREERLHYESTGVSSTMGYLLAEAFKAAPSMVLRHVYVYAFRGRQIIEYLLNTPDQVYVFPFSCLCSGNCYEHVDRLEVCAQLLRDFRTTVDPRDPHETFTLAILEKLASTLRDRREKRKKTSPGDVGGEGVGGDGIETMGQTIGNGIAGINRKTTGQTTGNGGAGIDRKNTGHGGIDRKTTGNGRKTTDHGGIGIDRQTTGNGRKTTDHGGIGIDRKTTDHGGIGIDRKTTDHGGIGIDRQTTGNGRKTTDHGGIGIDRKTTCHGGIGIDRQTTSNGSQNKADYEDIYDPIPCDDDGYDHNRHPHLDREARKRAHRSTDANACRQRQAAEMLEYIESELNDARLTGHRFSSINAHRHMIVCFRTMSAWRQFTAKYCQRYLKPPHAVDPSRYPLACDFFQRGHTLSTLFFNSFTNVSHVFNTVSYLCRPSNPYRFRSLYPTLPALDHLYETWHKVNSKCPADDKERRTLDKSKARLLDLFLEHFEGAAKRFNFDSQGRCDGKSLHLLNNIGRFFLAETGARDRTLSFEERTKIGLRALWQPKVWENGHFYVSVPLIQHGLAMYWSIVDESLVLQTNFLLQSYYLRYRIKEMAMFMFRSNRQQYYTRLGYIFAYMFNQYPLMHRFPIRHDATVRVVRAPGFSVRLEFAARDGKVDSDDGCGNENVMLFGSLFDLLIPLNAVNSNKLARLHDTQIKGQK